MSAQPKAYTIIREEHRALAAMLHALRILVRNVAQNRAEPNFEVLRALVFYVDAFPERLHHPKETEFLFKALRQRSTEANEVLDKLDRDHEKGEAAILRLEHALLEYEQLGESRLAAFAEAVEKYCDAYVVHMQLEETQVLPLALKVLTEDDWAHIGAAFAENKDPLTGHTPSKEFEKLFSKIVHLAPAPIGLGAAM